MSPLKATLFILACASTQVHGMELSSDDFTLRLDGLIEKGDLNKVVTAVSGPRGFPKYFTLNSPGGDIVEAMKIGKFVRETLTDTFVSRTCASACVFVLLAGSSQSTLDSARIGIHRPYFGKEYFAGLSRGDAEKTYGQMQMVAKQYLVDMEAPTWLIEEMFSVPSDDVRFLSPSQKMQLRVSPAAYSEWMRARCNPPTAAERKRFNIFDEPGPSAPHFDEFQKFKRQYEASIRCEDALRREARAAVLKRYR